MFYHDDNLDVLANKKAEIGCRASLKAVADKYTNTGTAQKILMAYEQASRLGHLRTDIDITMVCLNQGVLYFHKPLHEVQNIVNTMVPPVKGKVPPRVLTKMVASRIQEIVNVIKLKNKYSLDSYNWSKSNAAQANQSPPSPPVLTPVPDNFRTIQSIRDYFTAQPKNSWDMKQLEKKVEKDVLNKPELTDEIVASAMDLVICGFVTEE